MVTELALRDGTPAMIWSLLPTDRETLREGYQRLSPESQLHRFLTPVPHLSESMLVHLVDEVDGVNHVALMLFVINAEHDGVPVGVARMIRYPHDPAAADVAVTVGDEYQGRGVATALLDELLRRRPAGVERIVTTVAGDNPASLAMLRRLGTTTVTHEGVNRLGVTVDLPTPEQSTGDDAHPDPPRRDEAPGL